MTSIIVALPTLGQTIFEDSEEIANQNHFPIEICSFLSLTCVCFAYILIWFILPLTIQSLWNLLFKEIGLGCSPAESSTVKFDTTKLLIELAMIY